MGALGSPASAAVSIRAAGPPPLLPRAAVRTLATWEVRMAQPLVFACGSCGGLNRVPTEKVGSDPTCGRCGTALDPSGAPVHADDATLERWVRSSPVPVLVDFYADWCGPCRSLAPILDAVARRHAGRAIVVKVDTERHQEHARRLGVSGIPAVFLFAGGQVVEQAAGLRPPAFYEALLARHGG
jgi:thioredoxin 2